MGIFCGWFLQVACPAANRLTRRPPRGARRPRSRRRDAPRQCRKWSGSYPARPGADSRAAPAGCPDPGGPRRLSNAARGPAASATRPLFARPVALHCRKPVWSGRRGTRGGGRRVRPATARRACRPPGPGRPRRPRRPSAGRRPEPPDAVGLGAVSRSRLNRRRPSSRWLRRRGTAGPPWPTRHASTCGAVTSSMPADGE